MIHIGLDKETREKSIGCLQVLLADEYVLYVKTQKFHWNVTGPFLGSLHKLFNDHYEELAEFNDAIAERVRALGAMSIGTLKEFLEQSSLQENPGVNPSYDQMIAELVADHEKVIQKMRTYAEDTQEWEDMGTNNFLLNLLEKHEKMAWMLRAHLEK